MEEQQVFERLLGILKQYRNRRGPLVDYHEPETLQQLLQLDTPQEPGDWEQVFDWVETYLDYAVQTNHPGFVNRMWTGANLPSIVGEIVAAVSNTSACTYESAPVSTLMEKYMLGVMLEMVGFSRGEGQMATGSSNANMIAMLAARNEADSKIKTQGLFSHRELFAFVNADAHYSMDKAANMLGIGTAHLVKVETDNDGRMDHGVLAKQLAEVTASGGIPFFVGATAGTTVRGAYDDLKPLLDLRRKYPFWLHVDGAWGGAVIVSDTLRRRFLLGIEEVDSFTWDFHKMLGSALVCNVLLINNRPGVLGKVCSGGDESYIFRSGADNEVRDLGSVSLQCGRRVDALKWFLDWKFYGKAGLAKRVEQYLQLCEYAEQLVIQTPELEMVVPRVSFNICFRFRVPAGVSEDRFNMALRSYLHRKGISLVGYATVNGTLVLRLLIANSTFDRQDVERFFQDLISGGRTLLQTFEE